MAMIDLLVTVIELRAIERVERQSEPAWAAEFVAASRGAGLNVFRR
jgi:hypothetical protein